MEVFSYRTTLEKYLNDRSSSPWMLPELAQLRQLGLTEGELKVYEALLTLGEATKTALAKASGIAPANLYDVTNRLHEKGIISVIEQDGVKHFSPVHPRHLLSFLEKKEQALAEEKALVRSLLPGLEAAFTERSESSRIQVFTGWRGLKTVFDDLLAECTEADRNYVYGAAEGESAQRADTFFLKYSRMRARKGIPLSIIFNADVKGRQERIAFFLESRECDVRFLEQRSNTEIMLYRDTCVILILAHEPLSIRIKDAKVFDSFKLHFDALWAVAKG